MLKINININYVRQLQLYPLILPFWKDKENGHFVIKKCKFIK